MSVQQDLTDMHTACVNRLAGVFQSNACEGVSLQDEGYKGFVDPSFSTDGSDEINSDFLSIGVDDAQHFKIVGAKSTVDASPEIVEREEELESQLDDVLVLHDVTTEMVDEFLSVKSTTTSPTIQEPVAIFPRRAYDLHESTITDYCSENDIIGWTIDIGHNESVCKVIGTHSVPTMDEVLSGRGGQQGIRLHDIDCSLCPVVRNSDMRLIKFRFVSRLISYAYRQQSTQIPYSKIDEIMLDGRPPILGQLSEESRDSYWQQCMLTLRNTLNLVEESQEGINTFKWKKERFLYDKSTRSSLIEDVREDLGLGEEA